MEDIEKKIWAPILEPNPELLLKLDTLDTIGIKIIKIEIRIGFKYSPLLILKCLLSIFDINKGNVTIK